MENRRRSCWETKLPASGERATPFLRIRPSWTGVTETLAAPMSTTSAVAFPAAKLVIWFSYRTSKERSVGNSDVRC